MRSASWPVALKMLDGSGLMRRMPQTSGAMSGSGALINATIIHRKSDRRLTASHQRLWVSARLVNPNTMAGVSPGMACGPATDAINCGTTIVTAGGIDTHVHSICPQIDNTALAGGCTTLVAGGFDLTDGTNATTVTSRRRVQR